MSTPVTYDLYCYKGQTFFQNLRYKVAESGDVYDLTGHEAKAQIRRFENDETLVAEITTIVSGADGVISLSLTAEQTAALLPGSYTWDLRTVADGTVRYWIKGKFIVDGRTTA